MQKKLLVLLFILAFVVRLWGIYPGFPYYHPDESQIYSRALLILQGREEDLGYWGYPALIPLINAQLFGVFFIPLTILFNGIRNVDYIMSDAFSYNQFLQNFVYGIREINVLYWGRIISAIFGGLSVILIYLVGKKYFGKFVGVVSALMLALNARHVLGSHFALPDVANSFFLLIPLILSYKILKGGTTKDYLLAGLASGLSMSVKLSPFGVVPPIVSHFFSSKKLFIKESIFKILTLIAFFVFIVLTINLFHLFHLEPFSQDLDKLNKRYLTGSFNLLTYPYLYLFREGITPIISILSIMGMIYGITRYTKKTLILIGPVLLMFFALTYYSIGGVYVRNFIAIIPLILLFSGVGVWFVAKKSKIIAFVVICFSLIQPLKSTINIGNSYSNKWNIDQVKDYFDSSLKGEIVASTSWFSSYLKNPEITFTNWDFNSSFNLDELREGKARYVLVDTDLFDPLTTWWMSFRGLNNLVIFPNELLYSTFSIASVNELLGFRTQEFTKPPGVPETNFFLVKLPDSSDKFEGKITFKENFDNRVDWKVKEVSGKIVPNTGQIYEEGCGGCIKIGQIKSTDSMDNYLTSAGVPRTFSYQSKVFEFDEGYEYRVSADIWNNSVLQKDQRDGFIKIELYKNSESFVEGNPGDLVFVSKRYFSESAKKMQVEKIVSIPEGYHFGTVSFQVDRNKNGDFYFDNLLIEKSHFKKDKKLELKEFPEELFFIDSIL